MESSKLERTFTFIKAFATARYLNRRMLGKDKTPPELVSVPEKYVRN